MARIFVILLILFAISKFAHAQSLIEFEHLTTANGLSSNIVTSVLQDKQGFLWVGTENGLNRYDGYEFQVFRSDPSRPNSLSNNKISTLYQDDSGELWIGTGNGLNRFDYYNFNFERFHLSDNAVISITESQAGNLIIGTETGVISFNIAKSEFELLFSNHPGHILNQTKVSALLKDAHDTLWVGTDEGLFNWDSKTDTFTKYEHNEANPDSLVDNAILTLYQDTRGYLWIGIDGGLSRLNPETGKIRNFYHYEDGDNKELVGDEVLAVIEDHLGYIWVATTEGLNRYNPENNEFLAYIHQPEFSNSLAHSEVKSLLVDRSGILWVGTKGGGLSRLNLKRKPFQYSQHHPKKDDSLGYDSVLSFYEDKNGSIWVGLDDEGFNRFSPETKIFERFEYEAEDYAAVETQEGIFYVDSGGIHKDRIRAIQIDGRDNLWLGTSEGLEYFDVSNTAFRHFSPRPERPHGLSHEDIYKLILAAEDTLWIATMGGGLNRFNPQNYHNEIFQFEPDNPKSISSNQLTTMIQDRSGELWIGTLEHGLNRFNPDKREFIRLPHEPGNPNSLSHNQVWSLHQASSGDIWIGTSNGLNRYDPQSEIFQYFGEGHGISDAHILGILEDTQGNLWLSKEKGLTRFNLQTYHVTNYSARNGLPTDQFLPGAHFISATGIIYLGSNQGMVYFDPATIHENNHVPPIALTKLQILNNVILPGEGSRLDVAISEAKSLDLSYKDKAISFTFAALDYANSDNNRYAYRLEGFDDDWNDIGHRRIASYTSLPAGSYNFKVKGTNNDGLWNEEGLSLALRVAPPPWQTWWAYCLYALAALLFVVGYNRYRTLKMRQKLVAQEQANWQLEQKVAERTQELHLKNAELERSNKEILSSIRYAQKIQNSLLPNVNTVKEIFSDCFIVWRPRDIVGGDVYYIDQLQKKTIIAVIDCTGHGVPGAFMTMLASSGLRRITVDEGCLEPAKVLSRLNSIVKTSLQQDSDYVDSDDGLDAAICLIDPNKKQLAFSGANLPLTYIEKNNVETIKGDRESIGYKRSKIDYEFTTHQLAIKEGMSFYLYTDGITDQLGGNKRRMFGNRRLHETLLETYRLPTQQQKQQVIVEFENYRSEHAVQDDITLIGFRI